MASAQWGKTHILYKNTVVGYIAPMRGADGMRRFSSIDIDRGADMKHIQAWFELIAGISRDEMARLARAREIFADDQPDLAVLQVPACWRRPARIRTIGG
jgi:hypothetical protein